MPTPTPTLPHPERLERICQGLAALDAMVCEDWAYRYYSFDRAWSPAARLASMRDGSGDEWFLAFAPSGAGAGAFFSASWHGAPELPPPSASPPPYQGIPAALEPYVTEPAFSGSPRTYAGWFDGSSWTLRGQVGALGDELVMLGGDARAYQSHARDYFEIELPLEAIVHVLDGKPIDAALLAELGSNRTLAEVDADLKEIGY